MVFFIVRLSLEIKKIIREFLISFDILIEGQLKCASKKNMCAFYTSIEMCALKKIF